jgi:hypothetical protein
MPKKPGIGQFDARFSAEAVAAGAASQNNGQNTLRPYESGVSTGKYQTNYSGQNMLRPCESAVSCGNWQINYSSQNMYYDMQNKSTVSFRFTNKSTVGFRFTNGFQQQTANKKR